MSKFELRILDLDGEVVEVMEFETLRQAEKAEAGVRINLDLANYYTSIEKDDKRMTNADIREAHKLLDSLFDNLGLSHAQINLIRGLVPELPKQKTLTELRHEVWDAWFGADGNEWPDDAHGVLKTWLGELHTQLQGLEHDAPEMAQALAEETWEYAAQAKRGDSWETCISSETHLEEWWAGKDDAEWEAGRLEEQGRETRLVRRRVSPPEVIDE